MAATISLLEQQCYQVLGDFIASVLPSAVSISQGLTNLVPPSAGANYIIMSPLRRRRLGTNETCYFDNIITGSISATTLAVTAATQIEGAGLQPGMLLVDTASPMNLAANTTIVQQVSGTPGGVGTYTIAPPQTVAPETIYAGQRADLTETEFVAQVDVYGPSSADYAQVLATLLRSEAATLFFDAENPAIAPLHADDPRQIAFVDGEQQYEERWTLEVYLQVNPVIGTAQQFFAQPEVTLVDVETTYPSS